MTDVLTFLGLEPAGELHRWRLPVTRAVCGGATGALFGGVALAAGVEAMERVTGRPLVWGTVQYLSFARPPAVIDLLSGKLERRRLTGFSSFVIKSGSDG